MPKRIVVLCDGTWCGDSHTESNVEILAKMFKKIEDCPENVKYFNGVGVKDNSLYYLINGAFALSIKNYVVEAYKFIADRYNSYQGETQKPEIWLFGLSRGAYTVRCVAGMIHNFGILKNCKLETCNYFYELYRDRRPEYAPGSTFSRDVRALLSHRAEKPIKFMGLFDTVGSLGVPKILEAGRFDYEFYDTIVSSSVEYAFQATAIHDRLAFFRPCNIDRKVEDDSGKTGGGVPQSQDFEQQVNIDKKMCPEPPCLANIEECLLPGCHYDIARQEFVPWRKGQSFLTDITFTVIDKCLSIFDWTIGYRPGILAGTRVKPNHYFADNALNYILNKACQIGLDKSSVAGYFADLKLDKLRHGTGDVYDVVKFPSATVDRTLPVKNPSVIAGGRYGNVVLFRSDYYGEPRKPGRPKDLYDPLNYVARRYKYKSNSLGPYMDLVMNRNLSTYYHNYPYADFRFTASGEPYDYQSFVISDVSPPDREGLKF